MNYSKNVTLITSIINMPKDAGPFSYTPIRSVYSMEERFIQTKKTIETIRTKIPDNIILFVECSMIDEDTENYLYEHTDIFINLWTMKVIKNIFTNKKNEDLLLDANAIKQRVFSKSKSLGEGTITIEAIKFLFKNNFLFKNLFKISGRYWLNDNFNYHLYDNNFICVKICGVNVTTFLYKMNYDNVKLLLDYLESPLVYNYFINCVAYEEIIKNFISNIISNIDNIQNINILGASGNISVDGYEINF